MPILHYILNSNDMNILYCVNIYADLQILVCKSVISQGSVSPLHIQVVTWATNAIQIRCSEAEQKRGWGAPRILLAEASFVLDSWLLWRMRKCNGYGRGLWYFGWAQRGTQEQSAHFCMKRINDFPPGRLKKTPIWNPRKFLPVSVDNTDGPRVWISVKRRHHKGSSSSHEET